MALGFPAEVISPPRGSPTAITFASFRLDLRGGRLLRGDKTVTLRPKTWAVLLHLAQRPGVLVTKDGLLDAVWPGIAVTPDVISKSIGELRLALGDDSRTPQFIETVQRRGFRFIVPTRTASDEAPPAGRVFVGREEELQQLSARLAQAQAGERQIVFVTGPAGIGKTALIDAFLDSPAVRGAVPPVWIGRAGCIEHHGPREAYMPVLEALERLGRRSDAGQLLQLLRRTAPMWLVQMPWLLEKTDIAALRKSLQAVRSTRMLREFGVLLEALTRDVTLVLVLEDLHWSDPSTVDLLALLGQRRDPARLLVIGTYRPADVAVSEHPLAGAVRTLQVHRHCEQLPLLDLTEDAVRRYLEVRFPGGDFSPALAHRIHSHTDGDPLFMVAIVDHMLSRGWILDTAPGWALPAPLETMDLGVPDDVRLVIESQLARLGPAERSLLEAASVAGADVVAPVVAVALRCDVAEAEHRCETLARTQRFLCVAGSVDWPDGKVVRRYAFSHELHRQVVYEGMPEGQCARLHQCVGEALEVAYDRSALNISPRLARHFELSRDQVRAVRYLAAAGAKARERGANREAIGYFEAALAKAASLPDSDEGFRQELTIRLLLGAALGALHGYAADEVRTNYERASVLCAAVGNVEQLFETLYARWFLHGMRAEGDEMTAILTQMEELARSLNTAEHDVLVGSAQVRSAMWQGRLIETRNPMALLQARAGGRNPVTSVAYGVDPVIAATTHYAIALWFLGDLTGARAAARTGLAQARKSSDVFTLCAALVQVSLLNLLSRDATAGAAAAAEALSLSAEQGFALWNAFAVALLGWVQVQRGEPGAGCADIERGLAGLQATGARFFLAFVQGFLAEGRLRAGKLAEAMAATNAGLALAERGFDRAYEPELWRLKGELQLLPTVDGRRSTADSSRRAHARAVDRRVSARNWDEAEHSLLHALELSRAAQAKSLELRAATSLARAWCTRGRAAEARTLLAGVCDWFGAASGIADLAEARALLGGLATAH